MKESNPSVQKETTPIVICCTVCLSTIPKDIESRDELEIHLAQRFKLTSIGEIVDRDWRELPDRFPMVPLDEYVIMPNHVHGIVIINALSESKTNDARQGVAARATPTLGTTIGAFKQKKTRKTRTGSEAADKPMH